MSAFVPLVRLRAIEVIRTWRVWVFPAVVLFLALTGPLITRFTPEILAGAFGSAEAAALLLPEPTAADAASRWIADLSQLAIFVVVVLAAGAITGEVRSGVASLMLVKPASRRSYVLSHGVVLGGFVAICVLGGAVVVWGLIDLVWAGRGASGLDLLGAVLMATALWLVHAALNMGVTLLASAAFSSWAAAAGVGIGAHLVLSIAGAAPLLREFTPAGLTSAASSVAAGASVGAGDVWWPVLVGLGALIVALWAAVTVFGHKELT